MQNRKLDTTEKFAISDTVFKLRFFIPLIILSLAQICNNGMYYITQYSINQIGSTFEMNMLIIGALEFVAYFITSTDAYDSRHLLPQDEEEALADILHATLRSNRHPLPVRLPSSEQVVGCRPIH